MSKLGSISTWCRAATLGVAAAISATGAVRAQTVREYQVQGVAVATGAQFYGAGVGFALRPRGRSRIALSLSGGTTGDVAAGRAEVLFSYHVNPYARRGVTPYVFGGGAVLATSANHREYLVLGAGVETTPGRRWGLFLEGGVGGGLRIAGGIRIRRR